MPNEHGHDDHAQLSPDRLELFSDAVLAIIITITVLNVKIPAGSSLVSLQAVLPLFIAYMISFQTIGTYWNNHHHLISITKHISADIMWLNLHLLFWLSLIPAVTSWLGANYGAPLPTALYAIILLFCAVAYTMLQYAVVWHSEKREQIMQELLKSRKSTISLICYILAIPAAFVNPIISDLLIIFVSLMWFIPDRRIQKFIFSKQP